MCWSSLSPISDSVMSSVRISVLGLFNCYPYYNIFLVKMQCLFDSIAYHIPSFKRSGVYFILGLLGVAFILKIKIEENEIMCQFKTIRYFLKHAVWNCWIKNVKYGFLSISSPKHPLSEWIFQLLFSAFCSQGDHVKQKNTWDCTKNKFYL